VGTEVIDAFCGVGVVFETVSRVVGTQGTHRATRVCAFGVADVGADSLREAASTHAGAVSLLGTGGRRGSAGSQCLGVVYEYLLLLEHHLIDVDFLQLGVWDRDGEDVSAGVITAVLGGS